MDRTQEDPDVEPEAEADAEPATDDIEGPIVDEGVLTDGTEPAGFGASSLEG